MNKGLNRQALVILLINLIPSQPSLMLANPNRWTNDDALIERQVKNALNKPETFQEGLLWLAKSLRAMQQSCRELNTQINQSKQEHWNGLLRKAHRKLFDPEFVKFKPYVEELECCYQALLKAQQNNLEADITPVDEAKFAPDFNLFYQNTTKRLKQKEDFKSALIDLGLLAVHDLLENDFQARLKVAHLYRKAKQEAMYFGWKAYHKDFLDAIDLALNAKQKCGVFIWAEDEARKILTDLYLKWTDVKAVAQEGERYQQAAQQTVQAQSISQKQKFQQMFQPTGNPYAAHDLKHLPKKRHGKAPAKPIRSPLNQQAKTTPSKSKKAKSCSAAPKKDRNSDKPKKCGAKKTAKDKQLDQGELFLVDLGNNEKLLCRVPPISEKKGKPNKVVTADGKIINAPKEATIVGGVSGLTEPLKKPSKKAKKPLVQETASSTPQPATSEQSTINQATPSALSPTTPVAGPSLEEQKASVQAAMFNANRG